jgi:hypothetical protein
MRSANRLGSADPTLGRPSSADTVSKVARSDGWVCFGICGTAKGLNDRCGLTRQKSAKVLVGVRDGDARQGKCRGAEVFGVAGQKHVNATVTTD